MREFCTSGSVGGLGPARPVPGLPDSTVDSRLSSVRVHSSKGGRRSSLRHRDGAWPTNCRLGADLIVTSIFGTLST